MKRIILILTLFIVYGSHASAQCDPPSILWDEEGLIINWIPKTNATGHTLQYRESGTFPWTTVDIPEFTSTFSLSILDQCIEYDIRVRTICDDEQSGFSGIYNARPQCFTCFEDYCEVPDLFPNSIHITSFTINGITNTSTFNSDPDGYDDFRGSLERRYEPGEQVNVSIEIAESSFGAPILGMYIDYNRNFIYDEDEEVLELVFENGSLVETGTFFIPETALFGINRLRLVVASAFNGIVEPCEENTTSFSGEVEEYCIVIENPCDLAFAAELITVDQQGAFFTWEELEIAAAYNIRYKKTSESEADWTDLSSLEPEILLGNLDECTEYEFEVRGVCPFDTSAYKNKIIFDSFCATSTNEVKIIESISSYPNPWSSDFTLTIQSSEATEVTLELINNTGQSMGQTIYQRLSQGKNKIQLQDYSSIPSGLYLVKIMDDNGNVDFYKTLKIQ
jgi:hypothetical protein